MGVRTSSEVFKKKDTTGVAIVGGEPIVRPDPDATIAYLFPVPVQGTSNVSLDIDGEVKQLELQDGAFVIPKGWSQDKKDAYRNTFLAAGFTETSFMEGKAKRPPKVEKKYRYYAGHPENTQAVKKEGRLAVEVKGKKVELELDKGVIATEDKALYEVLIGKGFYEVKPAEEIKDTK